MPSQVPLQIRKRNELNAKGIDHRGQARREKREAQDRQEAEDLHGPAGPKVNPALAIFLLVILVGSIIAQIFGR
ncbi:hypothetical protein H4R35_007296 [Dimargaris xerosporica]|nr:hypothetical protein H4R35_007296 [Dimargaris xerosporica]